jgi:hypothetical protein
MPTSVSNAIDLTGSDFAGRHATAELPEPMKTRKRVSLDNEHLLSKKSKTETENETTPSTKPLGGNSAAPVSSDSSANRAVSLESTRKKILGQRIARSLAAVSLSLQDDPYCFGRVISIIRGQTLDDDLYRVVYEDGGREDLNSLTLFGAFLCRIVRRSAPQFLIFFLLLSSLQQMHCFCIGRSCPSKLMTLPTHPIPTRSY